MKYLSLFLFSLVLIHSGCKKHVKKSLPVLVTSPVLIKANIAESGGTIVDDGRTPITQRGICWAEESEPTINDSITNDGSGNGSFTSTFTGLKAKTIYYVRAYATNAAGTAYGNELSFTSEAGLATVTTTEPSIGNSRAFVGGTVTDDGGSPVVERGVVYSRTPNPTIENSRISLGSGTGAFDSLTAILASEKDYYLRAYAINSSGISYGNEITFKSTVSFVVEDIDGNAYQYEYFCDKLITRQNLKTTRYNNGEPIVNGLTGFNWSSANVGAYTFPNGDVRMKEELGLLYNIQAVNEERNMCPAGWHIATDQDWKEFETCFGNMEQAVADRTGWRYFIERSVVEQLQRPGFLSNTDGTYHEFLKEGLYWTSTPSGSAGNWIRKYAPIQDDYPSLWRNPVRDSTLSVRCVKAYEGELD